MALDGGKKKLNRMTKSLKDLKVKIFADGADKAGMLSLYANPLIQGLTTNPSLMKKAGIADYEAFAKDILQTIKAKPISLEVFTDDFPEMKRQALKISQWAANVYTKIPITNSRGESSLPLIRELAAQGVKLNVTALLTLEQVHDVAQALNRQVPSVVSVFAGRIADTGVDPMPMMLACKALLANQPKAELLWASVREVLNLFQADACGCAIVTAPHDVLAKAIKMVGMGLPELSLDTVKTFAVDAKAAGYTL
jgi:transaldolase